MNLSTLSSCNSHPKTHKNKKPLPEDLVPITFGILLPSGCTNKSSTVHTENMSHTKIRAPIGSSTYIKMLLDSGASASIISENCVRTKNYYLRKTLSNTWSTMAGSFATSYETEVNLKLPELFHTAHISVPFHVTKQDSTCLLYTSPSPRDLSTSRMPSSA